MQNTPLKPVKPQEENVIRQVLFKYVPYWPLFILLFILALCTAYFYLRYTNPVYEASATLIIKDERKGYDDSKMVESLDQLQTKKIIENEVEVLKSRTLMDTVVKSLHLYALQYEEGRLKPTSAYINSPVRIKAADPDKIKGTPRINFRFDSATSSVVLENKISVKLNEWANTPYGILKFENNPNYIKPGKIRPLYFHLVPPQRIAGGLLGALGVSPSGKLSTIINLRFQDEIPKRAEDILNELIRSYNFAAVNEKNNLAKNTLAFVEERLNAVAAELASIETKVQKYKAERGAIDISMQGQLFLQNVSTNDQKLSDVNMQLAVLNQVEKFVTSKNNAGGIVPSTLGVSDPVLSQLLEKLYSSELEYEKLKNTVAENNPLLVSITDQMNKIRPSILENIQSQRRSLQASKGNLNSTNGMYNSMLQTIPAKERQLLEISREQSIKNGIYSFLLQKREETALSFSSNVSDSRIVDKAQAYPNPVSPKAKITYLLAIFAALALAIAIITIKELFNGKILYRYELEKLTSFPILGELAYQKNAAPIVIEKGKKTFIAEEFRRLRISLPFLGIGEDAKCIMVTSSIPGEGKSFVASNLAVSLSLTGKKVVLVDLDLNNPSLGHVFDKVSAVGVSDYLKGERELEHIINRIASHPNLFFVSAGTLPDNPSELISNGRIKDLLDFLEGNFDFVVVDTAPVVPVTDAFLVSPYCDATLYVVRHMYTPKKMIQRLDENNKINSLVNPAIVFNGVKPRGFFNKSYGYGYGYGYVYDYKPPKKNIKSLV